jgi:hypothetical protein
MMKVMNKFSSLFIFYQFEFEFHLMQIQLNEFKLHLMSLNIFIQMELDFHKNNSICGQKRGKKVS